MRVISPGSEGLADIGRMRDGTTITFPQVLRGRMAPPRPAPPAGVEIPHDERMGGGSVGGQPSDDDEIVVGMSNNCFDEDASDQGRGTGVSAGNRFGSPEVGANEPPAAPASLLEGDPAYDVPPQACSSLLSVIPTFAPGGASADQQQVWSVLPSPI